MFREERDIEDALMMNLVLEGKVVGFHKEPRGISLITAKMKHLFTGLQAIQVSHNFLLFF